MWPAKFSGSRVSVRTTFRASTSAAIRASPASASAIKTACSPSRTLSTPRTSRKCRDHIHLNSAGTSGAIKAASSATNQLPADSISRTRTPAGSTPTAASSAARVMTWRRSCWARRIGPASKPTPASGGVRCTQPASSRTTGGSTPSSRSTSACAMSTKRRLPRSATASRAGIRVRRYRPPAPTESLPDNWALSILPAATASRATRSGPTETTSGHASVSPTSRAAAVRPFSAARSAFSSAGTTTAMSCRPAAKGSEERATSAADRFRC